MPAKNIYHDAVVRALQADGWTITDDPLKIAYGGVNLYVDLGADRSTLAAERGAERIAVEVQSFLSPSAVRDLQEASGQYGMYRGILARSEPDRVLYMAVSKPVYETIFEQPIGQLTISEFRLRLLVFDADEQRIWKWIPTS